jgi:WG containing repeat
MKLVNCGKYMNIDGEIAISDKFNEAHDFHEGLSAVKKDSLWGFIDVKGNVVVPYRFDYAYDFKSGFAVVKKGNNYGIINKKGDIIAETKYSEISNFNLGYSCFKDAKTNNYGLIDVNGNVIIDGFKYPSYFYKNGFLCNWSGGSNKNVKEELLRKRDGIEQWSLVLNIHE